VETHTKKKVVVIMSFTDEDKEALGEDLDELKTNLAILERTAKGIQKDLRTLVTMAWIYIILSAIAGALIGVGIAVAGG
jgi:hypothetical protein